MKKYVVGVMISLLAIFLVACGNNEEEEANEPIGGSVEITDEEKIAEDTVVAVVNGEEVTGDIYNIIYSQLKLYAGQFDEEIDLEEIKESTMDSIIDRQLLFQQALEEGIEVSDDDAKSELDTIKTENPEALETVLAQFQITEDGFQEQLKFELTMYEYMDKMIDVTVTDEEIEEYYELAKEENEEVPAFDEVEQNIRAQMTEQKKLEAFQEKIDEVKLASEIDKKI